MKMFPCVTNNGQLPIDLSDCGYEPTDVGSLCASVTDGTHSTVKDDPEGDCYLLSCKNVKGGMLVTSDKDRKINREEFDHLRKRTQLAKGDILLTSVGTIGEMALLREDPINFEFQRSVALIKPEAGLVTSEFLYAYLRSISTFVKAQAHGAVQQCIFINDIKSIPAFYPGEHEIAAFTQKAKSAFDLIAANNNESKALASLRDALLPKLMSGEIDVSKVEF